MNLSQTYLKAADVIRTNGLYKGSFWGRPESSVGIEFTAAESPVCTVGALCVVVIGHPVPDVDKVDQVIMDFASRVVGGPVRPAAAVVEIATWNDAEERTPADVIAAFEQAAREAA